MQTKKSRLPIRRRTIFWVLCASLLILWGYLRYTGNLYKRLQASFEKNEEVFYQIKDACRRQLIEHGKTASFIKEDGEWIFETTMDGLDERELFEGRDYMALINNLEQQIKLKKIFIADDELSFIVDISFVMDIRGKKHVEFRYIEDRWFRMRAQGSVYADLDEDWFLLSDSDSYELRIVEEDKRDLQKKSFKDNIDAVNEYVKILKRFNILEGIGVSSYSSSGGANFERYFADNEEELNRFKDLMNELIEAIGFDIIFFGGSELEFSSNNDEKMGIVIKYSEASDFQEDRWNRDNIDEVLAPNWYYMVYFHYNPFEIER